jgi:hypothetical protein
LPHTILKGTVGEMDFIFMLTQNDATAPNALELVEAARPLGLKFIGFKDIGADAVTLRRLTQAIRAAGASPVMEIVATDREAELAAVALGRDLGVDTLMGGVHVEAALALLAGAKIDYLPFCGFPRGHPTLLDGSPDVVEAQCRAFLNQGCAGVDLLAYRATEAAPSQLVAAARRGLGAAARLVVAGSINGRDRIRAIAEAGADAFTIGTSVLDGSYAPGAGPLAAQLQAVLDDCRAS